MRRSAGRNGPWLIRKQLVIVATLAVVALALPGVASAGVSRPAVPHQAMLHRASITAHPACGNAPATVILSCLGAHGGATRKSSPQDSSIPGYTPGQLTAAYGAEEDDGGADDETVAVVEPYDDPNAETDLDAYRSNFGLPACTTANGCFLKINQSGNTSPLPAANLNWAGDISATLDMVSAICPQCWITLVETSNPGTVNLGTGVNTAVSFGSNVVITTDAQAESPADPGYDSTYFNHPGVAIVAASGNSGAGVVEYPAASQYVTAVGGTTLTQDTTTRGWTETAWDDDYGATNSGCSAYDPKPLWQTDTGCTTRTLNDVAADADPATGVAVYDTYETSTSGWQPGPAGNGVGGTGVAAGIIAGLYALAGAGTAGNSPASYPYTHPGLLNQVTGSTGTCTPAYLCTAGAGYNGPVGTGTPAATAALWGPGSQPAAIVDHAGSTRVFAHGTDNSVQVDSLPSGSSTWSKFSSLSGSWAGSPAAVAGSSGYDWVFETGPDGNLHVDDLPPGGTAWSGWSSLGNPGSPVIGVPAAAQDNSGVIRVFFRTATGALWQIASTSTGWSGFTSLGGTWPFDPAVNVGSGGYVKVYAVGASGALSTKQLAPGGTWPSSWTTIGGVLSGDPVAVQDQAGTTRVYIRDATTWALHEYYTASGTNVWNTDSLAGAWPSDVTASVGSGGYLKIFGIGISATMYQLQLPPGGTWAGWTNLNGNLNGVPATAQQTNGTNWVFARGNTGALEAASEPSSSTTWSAFVSLGGAIS